MSRIQLDADTLRKLHNLQQPLELCDEAGHVMGRVYPSFHPSKYKGWEPKISEEELDRREQEKGGFTTAEVLARLEKLS